MELPDVWGKGGALFAFSGFDGAAFSVGHLVGATGPAGMELEFFTDSPSSLIFQVSGEVSYRYEVVAGDVISSQALTPSGSLRIRLAFLDGKTLAGEVFAAELSEPERVFLALRMHGASADLYADSLALRAGDETLALSGSAPALQMLSNGLGSTLSKGDLLRFTLAYSRDGDPNAVLRASRRALNAFRDSLFSQRISFFTSLSLPAPADSLLRKTLLKCASVQKVNCLSAEGRISCDWTTPDRWPHRHMWIWDSAFHALGLRHFAPEWAKNAILAVLSRQREDGFIPHMMTADGARDSDIIQPPILSWAAWKVFRKTDDLEFLRLCYPKLKAMVLYDCALDSDDSGLSEWGNRGHYASGMDNSPRFDHPTADAPDLNAFLAGEMEYLRRMAALLRLPEEADMWSRLRSERTALINECLWDDDTGFYYDLSPEGRMVKVKTVAGFVPLFAGVCSPEQASALVAHLTSAPEFRRPFPVASVAADEPSFSDDMWRGPVWVNYNYLIIEGLRRYGYLELAENLSQATLAEIARWYAEDGVIYEFYDSESRQSPSLLSRKGKEGVKVNRRRVVSCIRDYHWTAAVYVDLTVMGEAHRIEGNAV